MKLNVNGAVNSSSSDISFPFFLEVTPPRSLRTSKIRSMEEDYCPVPSVRYMTQKLEALRYGIYT